MIGLDAAPKRLISCTRRHNIASAVPCIYRYIVLSGTG